VDASQGLADIARRILLLRSPKNRLLTSLFAAQRKFIEDQAEWKVACCTRRAGKSHTAATGLLDAAFSQANTDSLYLGLTRQSSERIMWPKFHEFKNLLGNHIELKPSKLVVQTSNGSRIWIIGADSPGLVDRLLGNKWKRVIIDEAQSFGDHLEYLIDDVLGPALLDLQGDLWLLGTPGPVPSGYFYNAMENPDSSFSRHFWSLLQNPYLPHAAQWLEKLKKRKGWTDANPTFRRQYLGEWCHDPSALVYRCFSDANVYEQMPYGAWDYVVGLDYGWHDQTAFCVIAYSVDHPAAYVVESYGQSHLIPSEVAQHLERLVAQYRPVRIVADTGGLGKSITEEMKKRYGFNIDAAQKTEKAAAIETLNGDFADGRFFVHKSHTELRRQMQVLVKDDKGQEDPSLPNDKCDAMLYAHRWSRHYWHREKPDTPTRDSARWLQEQEQNMLESAKRSQLTFMEEMEREHGYG
jgi:hypothetical protein